MEDKSIKDFDRAIEQAMNEHAVPPPFGAWNRIAAELDAPVAAAPIVRPFPIAAVGGFVAGALFLGGVVAGVLVYNGNNLNNITYPVASNVVAPAVSETTYAAPAVSETANTVTESNMIAAVLPSQQPSKAIAVKTVAADKASDSKVATLENNNDVAVPQVNVANNASNVTTPYYFPPVDITMDEQPVQKNAVPAKSTAIAKETNATKPAATSTSSEVKKRSSSSSSSNFRGIKFKKKRSKFTYGRIISTKKH